MKKPTWKQILKRLNEIDALKKEAKARGDWKRVHELNTDWHFVFRQSLG